MCTVHCVQCTMCTTGQVYVSAFTRLKVKFSLLIFASFLHLLQFSSLIYIIKFTSFGEGMDRERESGGRTERKIDSCFTAMILLNLESENGQTFDL